MIQFDTLSSLEKTDVEKVIQFNFAESGEAGFSMQYNALRKILLTIENSEMTDKSER